MGQLTDEAAELLLTSGTRWSTLKAAGREWRNTALATRAWQAALDHDGMTLSHHHDSPSGWCLKAGTDISVRSRNRGEIPRLSKPRLRKRLPSTEAASAYSDDDPAFGDGP